MEFDFAVRLIDWERLRGSLERVGKLTDLRVGVYRRDLIERTRATGAPAGQAGKMLRLACLALESGSAQFGDLGQRVDCVVVPVRVRRQVVGVVVCLSDAPAAGLAQAGVRGWTDELCGLVGEMVGAHTKARRSQARLLAQARRNRDFRARMAHRLRSPLSAIALRLEVLRSGALTEKAAVERVQEAMQASVREQTRMIEELIERPAPAA